MEKIIARCGLECTDCNAYRATVADDDDLRVKTAEEWSRMFKVDIPPETINCLGCQQNDQNKLFSHCRVCGIRSCAIGKGYATCAECADFGCEKVSEIWAYAPQAKSQLEEFRG
jgi:Zn finger protein HypA/HybF involved in hydrogenase expression